MTRLKKLHRAAQWVSPSLDAEGHPLRPGYHRIPLRTWLRAQRQLHAELTGKALRIVEGQS